MAWIALHQAVWTHRKTYALADALDLDETYAAAHIIRLWTWALDNAPEGNLGPATARTIARAASWKGDAELFTASLVTAGWLDLSGKNYSIHDWEKYAGKLIEHRRLEANRSARRRGLYNDEDLTKIIRARDGDICRYCGLIVDWKDRKSPKGGTYDHIDPNGENTPENLVVCCRGCNSRKGKRLPEDASMRLLPAQTDSSSTTGRLSAGNLPGNLGIVPNRTIPDPTGPDRPVPTPGVSNPQALVASPEKPPTSQASRESSNGEPAKKVVGNPRVQAFKDILIEAGKLDTFMDSGQDLAELKRCPANEQATRLGKAWVAVVTGTWKNAPEHLVANLTVQKLKAAVAASDAQRASRTPNGRPGMTAAESAAHEREIIAIAGDGS